MNLIVTLAGATILGLPIIVFFLYIDVQQTTAIRTSLKTAISYVSGLHCVGEKDTKFVEECLDLLSKIDECLTKNDTENLAIAQRQLANLTANYTNNDILESNLEILLNRVCDNVRAFLDFQQHESEVQNNYNPYGLDINSYFLPYIKFGVFAEISIRSRVLPQANAIFWLWQKTQYT